MHRDRVSCLMGLLCCVAHHPRINAAVDLLKQGELFK